MFSTLPLCLLAVSAPALAGDRTSPPPPPEPAVSFDALPASATVRPANLDGKPHQAQAQILTDRTPVRAGEPFRLGVRLVPDEGWHSYWRSPGDIGIPLSIAWTLPDGATAGPYAYPIPQRFEQSGIVSYGYSGPVLLFSEVTLPAAHPAGPLTLAGEASWLICKSSCIEGRAALSLPLEVVPADGAEPAPTPWAPLFDHYVAQHPTPLAEISAFSIEGALSQDVLRPEDAFEVVLVLTPKAATPLGLDPEYGTWPTFVPIFDSYQVFPDAIEVRKTPEGGLRASIKALALELEDLPKDAHVGGLFQIGVGDGVVRTEVTIPTPWAAKGSEVTPNPSPLFSVPTVEPGPGDGGADAGAGAGSGTEAAPAAGDGASTAAMLVFAFLGGVLLNVMPCVFPVITLKLFGLVSHASADAGRQRRAGLAYTAGILTSFLVLAGAVIAVKATAGGVGWGFQFQSPVYVATLATIVFAFGLSMFGVYEVPAIGAGAASRAASVGGLGGDFMNGVFATLLATPCTAPFMGPAIGFAFSQTALVIVLFFAVIGLGLAAPFLAIAFVPALFKLLPRPGAWMETFKQLMGFTLVATTLWMVDILARQVGTTGATGFLAFLIFVAGGAWIFGRWGGFEHGPGRRLGVAAVGGLVAAIGGWFFLDLDEEEAVAFSGTCRAEGLSFDESIPFQPFGEACVESLAGHTVFIDFTASWCLTCKVNERTVLETETVRSAFAAHGIVPLKADWTRSDPVITAWLQRFGRAGVPFYVFLPADGGEPVTLPEVITTGMVLEGIEAATGGR